MKASETKSTHSQQHSAEKQSFFSQEQDSAFFSESSHEQPFFSSSSGVGIQAKFSTFNGTFFRATSVPSIQTKCAACDEKERNLAEEPIAENPVQRMPAFESENQAPLQTKPLIQRQEQTGEETLLQTKLTLGQPGDQYEREADAVADRVVSLPKQRSSLSPTLQTKPLAKITPWVQHQVDTIQPKRLQRKPALNQQTGQSTIASSNLSSRLQSTRGGGSPLDTSTRSRMESAIGSNFSQVQIHTNSQAIQMSQELGAKAFTHGSDIYFNSNKYNPTSHEGEHLLAHELTHTVQQGASTRLKPADVQRQEEENEDLAKELEEADREQREAVDPLPAEQSRQQAETEAVAAEQAVAEQMPEVVPPAPEANAGATKPVEESRVAKPKRQKADTVKPSVPEEEPKGQVGQELDSKSTGVCDQAAEKAQNLADNEQAHDEAGEKLEQTESAVEPPPEEGQSRSNAEQVETLDQAPEPQADAEAARRERDQAIEASVPRSVKEMNEFKSEGKAKVIGNQVLAHTSKEVGEIQGTYSEIEQAPPAPPPDPSTALPNVEAAPETPQMDLGEGAVPALDPQHTDVSEFDQQSDALLEKEGISQEQLDMVDSGELAEANQNRKDLKQKVKDQPTEVQDFAKAQQAQVKSGMQTEEANTRTEMRQKRQQELDNSHKTQKETKSKMELKREEVTRKINEIYETAKSNVTTKLENLEQSSLKRFDEGQARYSELFESEVNRDVNAWKRERYSGFWAGVKWLKDKIVGIDHFPEIQMAFTNARERYVQRIDQLIVDINAANNQVIQECKQELANARIKIQEYVDSLEPALKETGQSAMQEMQAKLSEMDGLIEKKKKELQQKLCDKKETAIKAIDEKIEKMKSEMGGLVSKLGKLLLKAMLKFFKWAIEKMGGNSEQLMGILNKGEAVITRIVKDPIAFFKNLGKAVGGGINRFVANIKQHLIGGLVGWLTSAMSDSGLQLPGKFDLKGILSIVLQVANLTWTAIRAKLVKHLGERVVATAEKTVDIIKRVITEGPIALWNIIQEKAGELKTQVMEGIRNWVIAQVVKKAAAKLVMLLNPVGAIVQAIIAIYDVVMFFIENWDRIVSFVQSIFSSIGEIAMGQVGKAAAFIEKALAMTVPIVLSFLARFFGLSGIGKTIRGIIAKINKPIQNLIDKIVGFLAKLVKKLFGKGKAAAAKAKEKLIAWWNAKKQFNTKDGKNHSLFFQGVGKGAKLTLKSEPIHIGSWVAQKRKELKGNESPERISALNKIQRVLIPEITKITHPNPSKKPTMTMEQILSDLAVQIQIIGVDGEGPVPKMLVSPGFSSAKADGRIEAKFIFKDKNNHQPGTPTTGKEDLHGAFNEINRLGVRSRWRRGHLINKDFGGKASNSNLIPIPESVNQGVFPAFDNSMRALYSSKKVIHIEISIQRNHANDPNKLFVSNLKLDGGAMKFEGNQWIPDSSQAVQLIDVQIKHPSESAELTTSLSINSLIAKGKDAKREEIREVARSNGISESLIEEVLERGVQLQSVNDIDAIIDSSSRNELSKLRTKARVARAKAKGLITL